MGSICDIIGIRRTYLIGFIILIAGRLIMGFGPDLSPTVDSGRLAVMTGILIMSFGTAFMSPVIQTSIRRFTPLKARSTGFNIYYLLMNISAVIANVFLIEFFRKHFGAVDGGYWIINFGTLMVLLGCITTRFTRNPANGRRTSMPPSADLSSSSWRCGRNPPSANLSSSLC